MLEGVPVAPGSPATPAPFGRPRTAGAWHCSPLRFDLAWHRNAWCISNSVAEALRKRFTSVVAGRLCAADVAPGEAYQFDWSHEIVVMDVPGPLSRRYNLCRACLHALAPTRRG